MKLTVLLFSLLIFMLGSFTSSQARFKYDLHSHNSKEVAEQAKEILYRQRFLLSFCSNCPPDKASVRRIDMKSAKVEKLRGGHYGVKVRGKIVRGIKPPVFGGHCTEELIIYNPSVALDVDYERGIDLAYTYVWVPENERFESLASLMKLGNYKKDICIKALRIKK